MHKYTTNFDFEVSACQEIAGINISNANIENLRGLIPTSVDLKKNIDLMGVAFNAAVVNEFNKNGDGMNTRTAIESVQQFVHKPTNIEHDKKKIVGHIVNAGFSDYSDSSLIVNVDENETSPFNIALGAVVYKTVDKDFFETLRRSTDPQSATHNTVSASWEVGFSEYQIAVGSKCLKDAEIISDPKQIMEMKAMLRGFGGKGVMDDGTPIYRLIVGDVYPLGIGFTMKPAANVKGIISDDFKTEEEKDEKPVNSNANQVICLEKNNPKISQNLKNTVNTSNKNNIMELETLLSEIKASLTEKKFSEEAIAGMTATFADAIKQKDDEYKASLEAAEQEKAEIASAKEELQASVEAIKEELKTAQERIAGFEAEQAAEQAVARFNARMEEIDSLYDLEESDSAFIAEKIKGLDDSEESFASFKSELEVFWASKNKETKAKIEAEIQAKIDAEVEKRLTTTEASTEEVEEEVNVEEALANAEQTNEEIPNNNEAQASAKTLKDKFAAAFSRENILG